MNFGQHDPQPDDVKVDTGPSGVVTPMDMPFVSKRWGHEIWVANNELYCGKILFIRAGKWLSYHYHKIKDEVLYVQSGKMYFSFDVDGEPGSRPIDTGEAFHVNPFFKHQMEAITDTVLIEFSTKHRDEDSYRVTTDNVRTGEKDELA